MKKILLSLLWLAVFGSAKAQTFDEDLHQYFKLTGWEQVMQHLTINQNMYLEDAVRPTQRDSISKILETSFSELDKLLIEIHKHHFTQEAIRKMVQSNDTLLLQQKVSQLQDIIEKPEVNSLSAWQQRMETQLYAVLYGMTPTRKRREDWSDFNFQSQLRRVQDSIYMATDAFEIEAVWEEYQADSSNVALKQGCASRYNGFAWNQLLTGQYEKAAQTLKMGLQMDVTNLYLHTNVPLCYLLQGKYEMAKKLYLEFKDKPFGELGLELFRDAFLDDLRRFQKTKLIPAERLADVEKIKVLLSEGTVNSEKTEKP